MTGEPAPCDIVLKVCDLKIHYKLKRKHPFAPPSVVHAVDGVSFEVKRGTTFGLVGESGSGKSTTALGIMRLISTTSGRIILDGDDITDLKGEGLRRLRKRIQIIFQDPYSSLNPHQRAGDIVRDPMELLGIASQMEREKKVDQLFEWVGLRQEQRMLFPHQFSGGQRQRIGIARALASKPDLIVCDEPVSALDVAIQAQILNLLRHLQCQHQLTYLFISHDMGVVQYMCDVIAVMYLGQIVEQTDRIALFKNPLHPYTSALLSAVPSAKYSGRRKDHKLRKKGDPPNPIDPPPGCRFQSRCPLTEDRCLQMTPPLCEVKPGHKVACHRVEAG